MPRPCIRILCAVAVTWLALPPSSLATVSCRTACTKCTAQTEHQALLEVYCAMCHECRERRRAWRHFSPRKRKLGTGPGQRANSEDEFPDEPRCPEPPPCDSEAEDKYEQLKSTPPEETAAALNTAARATSVQGHPACQPQGATPCCLPLCPCPARPCTVAHTPQMMTVTESPTTAAPEFFYIHVGVPKDILNNL